VFSCADTEFTAKGKTVLCDGWKELERRYRATLNGKPDAEGDEENECILDAPTFAEGQSFDSPAARVTAHDTQPPKPHTEASLLSAMERAGSADTDPDAERKGLGTPATRAAVIEKLVKSGFVQRKGKQLMMPFLYLLLKTLYHS
jgi:DNA topoisomerase-3